MRLHTFAAIAALAATAACSKKEAPQAQPAPSAAPPAASSAPAAVDAGSARAVEVIEVPELAVRAKGSKVRVTWDAPPGTDVNDEAPFKVRWDRSEGLAEVPPDEKKPGAAVKNGFDVDVAPMPGVPHATLDGKLEIVVCDAVNHSVCLPVRRELNLGFVVSDAAPAEQRITVKLPAAKAR